MVVRSDEADSFCVACLLLAPWNLQCSLLQEKKERSAKARAKLKSVGKTVLLGTKAVNAMKPHEHGQGAEEEPMMNV